MPPKKSQSSAASSTSKPSKRAKLDPIENDSTVLSKEEEERLSNELIAQMIAEQEGGGDQYGYYDEYNNEANYGRIGRSAEASDDDDDYRVDYNYRPKSKSKRTAKSAPARKKAKPAPPPPKASKAKPAKDTEPTVSITSAAPDATSITTTALASQTEGTQESVIETPSVISPAPPPAPKKVKEMPSGMNTGVYSAEEERAFVEALDLFGRNWRKVEEHVKTRDSNSIRSHAQKHFIKLFRDNIPLPAKILETGPGYTLSGRDLDPYSAAAMPYLSQRHFDDPSLLPKQGGQVFIAPEGSRKAEKAEKAEKIEKAKKVKEMESKSGKDSSEDGAADAVKEMKELKIRKSRPKESHRSGTDSPPSEPSFAPVGRTDYSKARLRSTRDRSSINFRNMGSELDPLTMVKCEPFCGQPNSGVAGCQPFGLKVQSNVLLGMDFHAHLMTTEIIGFLAGTWEKATKTIHIQAIFPCRSLQTGQNHVNVEMDPTSEFEVRQEIEKRQMRVVGWYHSHPTFTPDPSLVDIENQASYQNLFKDESMNEEPFVGAIVGPYDERLPGLSSVINWFYISHSPQERGHPKRLLYDLIEDIELPEQESTLWSKLFDEYRDSPERTNFQEQWRQEETETKLQKMLVSLGRRMPWLRNNLLKTNIEDNEQDTQQETQQETQKESQQGTQKEAEKEVEQQDEQLTEQETQLDAKDLSEQVSTENFNVDIEHVIVAAQKQVEEMVKFEVGPKLELELEPESECSPMEGVEETKEEPPAPAPEQVPAPLEPEATPSSVQGEQPDQNMERSLSGSTISSGRGVGLATMIKDPFLIRVEQELSSWEPVLG